MDLVCSRFTCHRFPESNFDAGFEEKCYPQNRCSHSSSGAWSPSFARKTWTAPVWLASFRSLGSLECCQRFGSEAENCRPGFDCIAIGFVRCRCQSSFGFSGFAGFFGSAINPCLRRRIDFYPTRRSRSLDFGWRAVYYLSRLKLAGSAAGMAKSLEYFAIGLARFSSICFVWCSSLIISSPYTIYRHL